MQLCGLFVRLDFFPHPFWLSYNFSILLNSETCYFDITHQVSLAVGKMRKASLFDLFCKLNQHIRGRCRSHFQPLLKELNSFLGLVLEQRQIPRRPKVNVTWHGWKSLGSGSASLPLFPSTIILACPLELSDGTAAFL